MLAVQALATQLSNQTLAEPAVTTPSPAAAAKAAVVSAADCSQDDDALKIRHHSEPHPPQSMLSDAVSAKRVKVISFDQSLMNVSSLLLTAQSTSSSWDPSSSNPPNKRQCRSMSIPNDKELQSQWLQTQRRIHKPLAVRPNSGSRSKSHYYNHQRSSCQGRLPPIWPASSLAPEFTSPPESPRSRPSSASSGYFDSPLTSSCNLNKNRCQSLQALQSLSAQTANAGAAALGAAMSRQGALASHSYLSAKSMPSVSLDSLQASPHKQIPRCQSQPCVVANERRCGMKRRYGDDNNRPSINFTKMTETAVMLPGGEGMNYNAAPKPPSDSITTSTLPLAIRPPACNRYNGCAGGLVFPDRVLQTIASSPQDATTISSSISSPSDQPDFSPITLINSPPTSPIRLPLTQTSSAASDSGCSTTDEELCQITDGIDSEHPVLTSDDTADASDYCHCGIKPITSVLSTTNSAVKCDCDNEDSSVTACHLDTMFTMDSGGLVPDVELDIEMIENN